MLEINDTKKKKPIGDTQKRKRKESKHTTTENYQLTKEKRKKGTKNCKRAKKQ